MSSQADQHLVIQALDEAWHRRGKPSGVIFHSDQGSQYKSLLVRHRLVCYAMQQSMSRNLAQYTAHVGTMPQQKGFLEVSRLSGFPNWDTTQLKKRS